MSELQHFTRQQVSEALSDAQEIVEALELPSETESQAILWAAQKLCEKTIMQGAPTLLPMQGRIQ